MFIGVHGGGVAQLSEVVHASNGVGRSLGAAKGGQQHGGENRYDGDDHEQFDEREAGARNIGAPGPARAASWRVTVAGTWTRDRNHSGS